MKKLRVPIYMTEFKLSASIKLSLISQPPPLLSDTSSLGSAPSRSLIMATNDHTSLTSNDRLGLVSGRRVGL